MCVVGIVVLIFWLHAASTVVVFQSRFNELNDTSRIDNVADEFGQVRLRFDGDNTTGWFVQNKSVCTLNSKTNTWIKFPSLGVIESGRAKLSLTMRAGFDLDVRLAGLISIRISPRGYREISVFNDSCGMWCSETNRAVIAIVDSGVIGPNTTTNIEAYWTIAPTNVGNGSVTVTILQQGTDAFSMTASVAQSSVAFTGMPLWMVLARWYNDVCFHSMTVENGTFFPTTLPTRRSSTTSGSTMTTSMSSISSSTLSMLPSTVSTLFALSSSSSSSIAAESANLVPLAVGLSVSIILLISIALFIYLWRRRQPKANDSGASAEQQQYADTPSNANQNNYGSLTSVTRVVHEYESAETPLQA